MSHFFKYIEVPVKIFYEYQPAEHATKTYPGCPESVNIDDVQICTEEGKPIETIADLIDWAWAENDLEADAWDHRKERSEHDTGTQ